MVAWGDMLLMMYQGIPQERQLLGLHAKSHNSSLIQNYSACPGVNGIATTFSCFFFSFRITLHKQRVWWRAYIASQLRNQKRMRRTLKINYPCSKDPALPVKIQCTKQARHKPCVGKRLTNVDSTLPILHLKTTGALSARGGRTAGDGTACALSCVAEGTLHHPVCW